jgi:hypothetical protein
MPILTVISGAPCSMAAIMPIRIQSIFYCRSALRKAPSGLIEGSIGIVPGAFWQNKARAARVHRHPRHAHLSEPDKFA